MRICRYGGTFYQVGELTSDLKCVCGGGGGGKGGEGGEAEETPLLVSLYFFGGGGVGSKAPSLLPDSVVPDTR